LIDSLLDEYGIIGGDHDQHFLVDDNFLNQIVDSAELNENDTVLEIGAGIGNLTEKIAETVHKLYAVELDPNLCDILIERFADYENVEIIEGDILDIELPEFNKVVANLPYSISSHITFKLLKHEFELGILMYQYEFARRMVSPKNSKDYSRLTVTTNFFADASIIMKVPRSAFKPAPEVKSAVVKLIPRPASFDVVDENFFLTFVTSVFGQRRKKLRNAILNTNSKLGIANVKDVVNKLPDEYMNKRAENLEPSELAYIANQLFNFKTT
jgi:16S rRNA (adenine1518-N6/adenine1519-N6)-dimethyltransferase